MSFFSPLIEQAIELAAQWHAGTYRKGRWREPPFTPPEGEALRVPTMAHVTAVAMTVQRGGWSEEAVAAAFLHDVLEDENRYDQRFRVERMRDLMGEEVTRIVRTLSEEKRDAQGRRRKWRARKEGYLDQLRNGSDEAIAISLADKLHNLWSMNESLARDIGIFTDAPNRRALSAGPEAQRWFYHAVLTLAADRADARLIPLREQLQTEVDRFREFIQRDLDD
jgi:(p)ppGpp synthase/HD superfamily hydrolase